MGISGLHRVCARPLRPGHCRHDGRALWAIVSAMVARPEMPFGCAAPLRSRRTAGCVGTNATVSLSRRRPACTLFAAAAAAHPEAPAVVHGHATTVSLSCSERSAAGRVLRAARVARGAAWWPCCCRPSATRHRGAGDAQSRRGVRAARSRLARQPSGPAHAGDARAAGGHDLPLRRARAWRRSRR